MRNQIPWNQPRIFYYLREEEDGQGIGVLPRIWIDMFLRKIHACYTNSQRVALTQLIIDKFTF